jgi:hypothetical protein
MRKIKNDKPTKPGVLRPEKGSDDVVYHEGSGKSIKKMRKP